jgi:phosphoribosyl 1,2-cyclic phosphodiesterase
MDLLFHHDIIVATLASGSRGNCTYIGDLRSGVLVDCGLSTRQVLARLDLLGLGDVRIDAVLITHEHSDHVGGARVLDDRLFERQGARVPFHLTRGTRMGLDPRCKPERTELVVAGQRFRLGRFEIEPFTVPHDTRDPVAYLVSTHDTRKHQVTVGVVTDLGRPTRLVEQQLARMTVAILEFNHELEMLMDGPYPWKLKQRVRGPQGHLSNAQAAEILVAGASDRLQHLMLAHLSEDNNTPARALETAMGALARAGLPHVRVSVASQHEATGPIRVGLTSAPVPPPRPVALPAGLEPVNPTSGRPTSGRPAPMASSGELQLGLFAKTR